MNLLITGKPGIGKTTLIKKLIDASGREKFAGFYTEEVHDEKGERQGFKIVTLSGKEGILAKKGLKSKYRVGKYGVNIRNLEEIAVKEIEQALYNKVNAIIIDEIGPMEICSEKFRDAVIKALDSPLRVIATIKNASEPFLNKLRARNDVEIVEVNSNNRNNLSTIIVID